MTGQKSYLGLDKLYWALITDTSSAYTPDAPAVLAPVAAVAIDPTTNNKTQFFDNIPMESINSEGPSKLSLEIQGITLQTKAALLGKIYDASNGMMFDSGAPAPYVAVGFRAKLTDSGYRYYWFLKGNFAEPKDELVTQTDTPDPKTTKLEFNAIRTTYQFAQSISLTDSCKYVKADTSNPAFTGAATWFNSVKVPVVGAPSALTCSPVPTDGAGTVALASDITLTFNNALRANAENGITLVRADTAAVVAVARTIDAERKVVILNPTSNLVSGKVYHVIVPGVVDIYGQSLADVVYDFTTV